MLQTATNNIVLSFIFIILTIIPSTINAQSPSCGASLSINATDTIFCQGDSLTLQGMPSNDTLVYEILWNTGDTTAPIAATEAGLYSLVYSFNDSCQISDSINIVEYPTNSFSFAADPVCHGDSSVLIFSNIDSGLSSNYSLDFGDGTGVSDYPGSGFPSSLKYLYADPGTYFLEVILTDTTGCTFSYRDSLSVLTQPEADFDVPSEICRGESFFIQNNSAGVFNNLTIYTYSTDTGSPLQSTLDISSEAISYSTSGQKEIVIATDNTYGCVIDRDTFLINVKEQPEANFSSPQEICTGETFSIQNNSIGLVSNQTIYTFTSETGAAAVDTSDIESIVFSYNTAGMKEFIITVDNQNSCTSKDTLQILVKKLPLGNFVLPAEICKGEVFFIQNNSTKVISNQTVYTYSTDTGDTLVNTLDISNEAISYNTIGQKEIIITTDNGNGCPVDMDTFLVLVKEQPIAGFGSPEEICVGDFFSIQNNSTGLVANQTIYSYTSETGAISIDTSDIESVVFSYGTAGLKEFIITVDNQNGCTSKDTLQILVKELPLGEFVLPTEICKGEVFFIQNNSMGIISNQTVYTYSTDTGDTLVNTLDISNETISYNTIGQKEIIITTDNGNGCNLDMDTFSVLVKEQPIAGFGSPEEICVGEEISIQNNSLGLLSNQTVYTYITETGASPMITLDIDSVVFSYSTSGLKEIIISLDNQNGCTDSDTLQILVNEQPIADFNVPEEICRTHTFPIQNNSTGLLNNQTMYTYITETGAVPVDTSNIGSVTFSYNTTGVKEMIILIDNLNGCSDSDTFQVLVKEQPESNFNVPAEVCVGEEFLIQNNSSGLIANETTYTYTTEAGATAMDTLDISAIVFSYDSSGIKEMVTLIDNLNGCVDNDTFQIMVHEQPEGDFILPTNICVGDNFDILNNSTGLINNQTTYTYISEPGASPINTSDITSGDFFYSSAGPKEFTILTDNLNGCTDNDTFLISANAIPDVSFSGLALTYEYCAGDEPDTLTGIPAGGLFSGTYIDNVIDMGFGQGIFNPEVSGEDQIVLYQFTDTLGCYNADTLTSTVYSLPDFFFTGIDSMYCLGDEIDTIFSNFPGTIFSGESILDDTTLDNYAIFSPDIIDVGIRAEYLDSNGCTSVIIDSFVVNSLPIVDLGNDTVIVSGTSFDLSNSISSPAFDYEWSNGNTSPSILINNPGFYGLTITDSETSCVNDDGILIGFTSSILENGNMNLTDISYFPNPISNGNFIIQFNNPEMEHYSFLRDVRVNTRDIQGKSISSEIIILDESRISVEIKENLAAHQLLLVTISTGSDFYSFIVQTK